MNTKTFTNYLGKTYYLTEKAVKDKLSVHDQAQSADAKLKSDKNHIPYFYSLKDIKKGVAYYFLIPVDKNDIKRITKDYSDYIIGICYPENFNIEYDYSAQSGWDYEYDCAEYLKAHGFTDVEVTKGSGDQGIDIIANKDGLKYGIQCKLYKNPVSNKAIQEVYTGASFYGCDVAVVMTNSTFTESAKELAHKIGVKLWSSD